MLEPKKTRLMQQEESKTWIVDILEKDAKKPDAFHQAIKVPEIIMFAEEYDDPKLPDKPFVFGDKILMEIMAEKRKTMIIPIISLSPTFLIWFCLVNDCNILREKIELLKKYSNPDFIVKKTDICIESTQEFNAPLMDEIPDMNGTAIDLDKFREFTYVNKTLYIHSP